MGSVDLDSKGQSSNSETRKLNFSLHSENEDGQSVRTSDMQYF